MEHINSRMPITLYQASEIKRIGFAIFAAVFVCACLAGAIGGPRVLPEATADGLIAMRAGCLVLAAVVAAGLLSVWRSTVTFGPDWVETFNGVTTSPRLMRADISGLRSHRHADAMYIVAVPPAKSLKIPTSVFDRPGIPRWVDELPNLDEQEWQASLEELENDATLGATPEDRRAALKRLRWIARIGTGIALTAAVWCWFMPIPYAWALATTAIIPPIAVALHLWRASVFTLNMDERTTARPRLVGMYLMPLAALTTRAFGDFVVLDIPMLAIAVALLGVTLTVLFATLSETLRASWSALAAAGLACGAYAYGVLVQLNALPTPDQPYAQYYAQVLDKQTSDDDYRAHKLYLAAWGPEHRAGAIEVGAYVYRRAEIGDQICIAVERGWLRIRWYRPQMCPA
jgi:hypothetical protein